MFLTKQFESFVDLFRLHYERPELMRAQVEGLTRQIPMMYLLLTINSLGLSYTHYDQAPILLTVLFPGCLTVFCLFRSLVWIRTKSVLDDIATVLHMLRHIRVMSVFVSVLFTGWVIALYFYGDELHRVHVAYFISVTVVGCVFCLFQFPAVAISVVTVVFGGCIVAFSFNGTPIFHAILFNMLTVFLVVIYFIRNYYLSFADLLQSRKVLQEKHQQTLELSAQNEKLAYCDALTGLANRRDYFNILNAKIAHALQHGSDGSRIAPSEQFAVILVDLDGFKPVNDVYGHLAGDEILISAGKRICDVVGEEGYVARLGGDEFAAIVDEYNTVILDEISEKICVVLKQPFECAGGSVQLSATVGIAIFPFAARTAIGLFERADFALYHAKRNDRGTTMLFAACHETIIRQESRIAQSLRQADLAQELSLVFQPVYDLNTGKIYSVEALARWYNPELGPVAPDVFFPMAEKTNRVNDLTRTLFNKLLYEVENWPADIRFSFNLSARDLVVLEMTDWLIARIEQSNIEPRRITFEVTETAILRDFDAARDHIERLRGCGARVALDDFGIGFSSLRYVHELEIDCLKIDRSFVTPIVSNPRSQRIVKTVFDMCENFGIDCVVEGVETAEQCTMLRYLGGRYAQGYLLGRPAETVSFEPLTSVPCTSAITGD
ncbi:bifunctional diguanylate cyclase/phosphodiesterase [Thalassospira sp. TSL5-1]|uniref:putative bifunctional diguanylate cyclase/phosphodiesterase n=1 Tax=Thalassospira sp. TSL5-1 TaxID=1544451 RepID=UPI00093B0E9A|nr:EAL domain-containing protein [Thalassospira sp. TSL5-1]OKH89193.1 diguanylate cyclase [Thalassospira sp. TSL5-1]